MRGGVVGGGLALGSYAVMLDQVERGWGRGLALGSYAGMYYIECIECIPPLPYVSYSLPQAPFLPCASSQSSLAYINSDFRFNVFFGIHHTLPWGGQVTSMQISAD